MSPQFYIYSSFVKYVFKMYVSKMSALFMLCIRSNICPGHCLVTGEVRCASCCVSSR